MKICDVIESVKAFSEKTTEFGKPVNPERDKILYSVDLNCECTGIAVTAFASYDVIKRAGEAGANLIICHEGMFWNHGDDTSWLQDNAVYQEKKSLLDKYGITVWRNFEHVIAGIPLGKSYVDGIAYGLVKNLGWENMLDSVCVENHCHGFFLTFLLKEHRTAESLAYELRSKLGLSGISMVGDPKCMVHKLYYCRHQFLGYIDAAVIEEMEREEVDAIVCGEMVDYTVSAYVRESCMAGRPRAIIKLGNFNACEAGMSYFSLRLSEIFNNTLPVKYISSGDTVSVYL